MVNGNVDFIYEYKLPSCPVSEEQAGEVLRWLGIDLTAGLRNSKPFEPIPEVVKTVHDEYVRLSHDRCASCHNLYGNCRCNDGGEGDHYVRMEASKRYDGRPVSPTRATTKRTSAFQVTCSTAWIVLKTL